MDSFIFTDKDIYRYFQIGFSIHTESQHAYRIRIVLPIQSCRLRGVNPEPPAWRLQSLNAQSANAVKVLTARIDIRLWKFPHAKCVTQIFSSIDRVFNLSEFKPRHHLLDIVDE